MIRIALLTSRSGRFLSLCGRGCVGRRALSNGGESKLSADEKESFDDDDFFGIKFIDKKRDIAGEYVMKDKPNPVEKYDLLTKSRTRLDNEDTTVETVAGKVRLDSKNVIKYHGQYDESNTRLAFESIEGEFERKYNYNPAAEQIDDPTNAIDQEYFGKIADKTVASDGQLEDASGKSEEPVNWIDGQYFSNYFPPAEHPSREPLGEYKFKFTPGFREWAEEMQFQQLNQFDRARTELSAQPRKEFEVIEGINYAKRSPLKDIYEIKEELEEIQQEIHDEREQEGAAVDEQDDGIVDTGRKETLAAQSSPVPRTALEYIELLKRGKLTPETEQYAKHLEEKYGSASVSDEAAYDKFDGSGKELDSKGYLTYRDAVQDLSKMRKSELLWLLKDRIVFNDAGIVVLNKPYGLVCQETRKGDARKSSAAKAPASVVLFDMLKEFSALLFDEGLVFDPRNEKRPAKLHPLHRLDKEVSGLLILATSSERAAEVQKLFATRKIEKEYLAVTRNVPELREGIIDIPMEKGAVNGRERMVLRPELEEEYRRIAKPSTQAKRALTHYNVVSENKNAALLSIKPETGVKHQIRAHLGFGLRCPVLGDHKYTNLDRIVPQTLPADMLIALNVRQSKVRNIPMHLHAYRYAVPDVGRDGGTIYLKAPIPKYFRETCSKLKLRID